MAKIKINKLPEGFELKGNTIVQKNTMRDGGMVTGDQADYGLVTVPQDYYTGVAFNNDGETDVRYSLSGVPRDEANIEAEGGETVLTDLNNDGEFGLYDIKGPRHSKGGVPMFLPEQSFIYSDTDKMKFDKKNMSEFGINSKKKKTPAQISKQFPLNKMYAATDDEHADDITKRSADLMKDKYMMGLSKLAFKQEEKKKFEDGVPLASHPYLVSLGEDPIQFTANVEKITQQQAQMNMLAALPPEQQAQVMMLQQMMAQVDQQEMQGQQPMQESMEQEMMMQEQPMARYGTELPKAQIGLGSMFPPSSLGVNRSPNTMINGVDMMPDLSNINFEDIQSEQASVVIDEDTGETEAAVIATPHLPITHPKYDEFEGKIKTGNYDVVKTKTAEGETIVTLKEKETPIKNKKGIEQYNKLEKLFTSNSPQWTKTVDNAYSSFVAAARSRGFENIPGKDEVIDKFLNYQKNNYTIRDLASKDERLSKELDKGTGIMKNKNSQSLFNTLAERYPDRYSGYSVNEEDTKLNQLFFQTLAIADENNANPYLSYRAEGPQQNTNWFKNKTISKTDGFYGNNTLNQYLDAIDSEEETVVLKDDPVIETKKDWKIPNINKAPDPQEDWWIQDVNNLRALNLIDDNLYRPWRPDAAPVKIDYVLDDFRNGVNATLGSQNTIANALGTAGGAAAIVNSDITGKTLKNIGSNINTVNQNNIRTINSVAGRQAAMNMQIDQLNQRNAVGVYNDENKVLQNADNFKNWKVGKNAQLQNAAITNREFAITKNLEFPNVGINPATGGRIAFTNGRAFEKQPVVDQNKRQQQFFDAYNEFQKNTKQTKAPTFQDYLSFTGGQGLAANNNMTRGQAELARLGAINRPRKEGGEFIRMATPFYSGKMGMES